MTLLQISSLLKERHHEYRLAALLILVLQFERVSKDERSTVAKFYIDHLDHVNNWDLVDASVYKILGPYLETRERGALRELVASGDLWRKRVAMIVTYHFIKAGPFYDVLDISETLVDHPHGLVHKAVGWKLLEIGNRDRKVEEGFLKKHYKGVLRTMLRYAIEKSDNKTRKTYLDGRI